MTEQTPTPILEPIPDLEAPDETTEPIIEPDPATKPPAEPTEPAKTTRTRKAPAPAEPDSHAGHAVYDETLTRFVSEVFRGDAAEADAKAAAKALKDTGPAGHKYVVKSV